MVGGSPMMQMQMEIMMKGSKMLTTGSSAVRMRMRGEKQSGAAGGVNGSGGSDSAAYLQVMRECRSAKSKKTKSTTDWALLADTRGLSQDVMLFMFRVNNARNGEIM